MKTFHVSLQPFGFHLYVSRKRLRFFPSPKNRPGIERIRDMRNRRFRKRDGMCEICHEPYDKTAFQMHHILPFSVFPTLALKHWNLIMLCPRCHFMIHANPLQQIRLMERTARRHNINLEYEYSHIAVQRWTEKQQKKGAIL